MKTRTGGAVPIMNQYDTCQLVQKWFLVCWVVMVMSGSWYVCLSMVLFGKFVFSLVKTDLNWLLRISALSLLSDSFWWSLVRVGIPIVDLLLGF